MKKIFSAVFYLFIFSNETFASFPLSTETEVVVALNENGEATIKILTILSILCALGSVCALFFLAPEGLVLSLLLAILAIILGFFGLGYKLKLLAIFGIIIGGLNSVLTLLILAYIGFRNGMI